MTIKLYGSSDDLIEVEGDIREEFAYDGSGETYVCFSDGSAFRVNYDSNGIWRFDHVAKGVGEVSIVQAPLNDEDNYTDVVTIEPTLRTAPIAWVALAHELVIKRS